MSYNDRYPKAGAHGRRNDVVVCVHLPTGKDRTFIDDGFDVVDGVVSMHPQAALLQNALNKTVRGEPVFAIKDPAYKFAPNDRGIPHPLNSARRYNASEHKRIAESAEAARAAEVAVVEKFAEAQARPFAEAAKKASK